MSIGLYGGAFDPPHRGHVELARRAKEELGLGKLIILVSAHPGHKHVETPAEVRVRMAQAAFPDDQVMVDEHARTVDTLRAHSEWSDPVFLVGADQFCHFLTWKEPDEVLRRARIAVATRPGSPREQLQSVLEQLEQPDRVLFFEIEPMPIASRDLRNRFAESDVPSEVADIIRTDGLYTR